MKRAGVIILTSNKTEFKTKIIIRDREWHFIMIKNVNQEDITFINP